MGGPADAPAKKKLSYLEAREYSTIEQRVEAAEQLVQAKRAELENPANAMDAPRLVSAQAALDTAQQALDALYARWAELEKKNG
jgi:ATP-binding cassette subfamily F protein uup